jgi:hypothetical protein
MSLTDIRKILSLLLVNVRDKSIPQKKNFNISEDPLDPPQARLKDGFPPARE